MLLAIDTATHQAGLALYDQGQVWAEETWHSAMTHTIELMPRIQRMLNVNRMSVESLASIAVSLGPGSFTGLRIGLAAAKGMALPFRLPLIGIPTLDVVAYPFQGAGQPVWGIIQAGRMSLGHPGSGEGYELLAITACILGGLSLMGGEGGVLGILAGALLIGVLQNEMVMLNINPYWHRIVISLVLRAAITFDYVRRQRRN